MKHLFLLSFLWCSLALAQTATVAVVEAQNLNDNSIKKIVKSTEVALKLATSFELKESPPFSKSAPKKCEIGCAEDLARSIQSAAVLTIEGKAVEGKGEKVSILLNLFLDGDSQGTKRVDTSLDNLDSALKTAVDGLVPTFMKKGFGALRLETETNSVVKIDGKLANAKSGELVSVPAGFHMVDVVSENGNAVSSRIEVSEGSRTRVNEAEVLDLKVKQGVAGFSLLRATSYALFMVGSASLAGGLISGALGKGALKDVTSCSGMIRECTTLDVALAKQAQADSYANTGNIFLGVGAALLTAGVGLFVIDVVLE